MFQRAIRADPVNAALSLFLQQLGMTITILGAVITLARRREIAVFFSTHAQKARQIQRLEAENAELRSSLAGSVLANEGFQNRISQLADRVDAFEQTQESIASDFKTLTAKFTAGIAYIATELAHGDTSRLPALIRDDVVVEIQRQARSPR